MRWCSDVVIWWRGDVVIWRLWSLTFFTFQKSVKPSEDFHHLPSISIFRGVPRSKKNIIAVMARRVATWSRQIRRIRPPWLSASTGFMSPGASHQENVSWFTVTDLKRGHICHKYELHLVGDGITSNYTFMYIYVCWFINPSLSLSLYIHMTMTKKDVKSCRLDVGWWSHENYDSYSSP